MDLADADALALAQQTWDSANAVTAKALDIAGTGAAKDLQKVLAEADAAEATVQQTQAQADADAEQAWSESVWVGWQSTKSGRAAAEADQVDRVLEAKRRPSSRDSAMSAAMRPAFWRKVGPE